MKMQEFVKGQLARSRTVPGNIYEVVDVKTAEIMLRDSRDGSTRIFWAPRRNFEPVPHLDEAPTKKVDMPVIVEPRLPSDLTWGVSGFVVGEGARAGNAFYEVVGVDEVENLLRLKRILKPGNEQFIGLPESFWGDPDDYQPVTLTSAPHSLGPGEAAMINGQWTENVIVQNPVEGRIHVSTKHADSLTELSFILANAVEAKGFGLDDADPESPHFNEMISTRLMLAVGELAEAQEELRAGHSYAEVYEKDGKPEGFAVEIADAIYRLLHLSAALGIDIGLVLLEKNEFNLTRPYKHGKKF